MADDDALIPLNGPRPLTGAQQWQAAIEQQRQRDLIRPSMGEQIGNVINTNIDRVVHGNPFAQIAQMYQDIASGRLDPLSPEGAGRGLRTAAAMALEGMPYAQRGAVGTSGGKPFWHEMEAPKGSALTSDQVKWASKHDWFLADLGEGKILVNNRWYDRNTGKTFEQPFVWDSTFDALRDWAGY